MTNPYTPENIRITWNILYPMNQVSQNLNPTHHYVRFLPQNMDELKILESLDIDFFDFPLDFEIEAAGDYYHDPALPDDQITYMYALVKPGFVSPISNYIILEDLLMPPLEADLTKAAFGNLGLQYPSGKLLTPEDVGIGIWIDPLLGGGSGGDKRTCPEVCAAYPCCLLYPEMDCDEICEVEPHEPDCLPTNPDWPRCLGEESSGGTIYVTNSCGCEVYINARKPGGCIQVEDTQLPSNNTVNGASVHLEPVRKVKVLYKFGLFNYESTWTDDNGCWKINKEDKGKSRMWVKFKSETATIRGIRQIDLFSETTTAISTVSDPIGSIYGPVFNDISIIYTVPNDLFSPFRRSKLYWYAATANNALHEYHDNATADGMGGPPEGLDVLLTNFNGSAAAPMLDKIASNPLAGYTDLLFVMSAVLNLVNFANGGASLSLFNAKPDVVYNYGDESTSFSDQVRETFYHEYGHTSHYQAISPLLRDDYWVQNIIYIISNQFNGTNPPYGLRILSGSSRCAVIEMWGYHIGPTYAQRRYGTLHSRFPFLAPLRAQYINILEGGRGIICTGSIPCDFRFASGYIPQGVFLDCIDNNVTDYPPFSIYEDTGITDGVFGYSQADCFNSISTLGGASSVGIVKTRLRTTYLPTGQTATTVNTLFSGYGY